MKPLNRRTRKTKLAVFVTQRPSFWQTYKFVYYYYYYYYYYFTVHFSSLSFSPSYALKYIIKILSQAVTLIAHFTPTCFDPYGSSSGSTAGPC